MSTESRIIQILFFMIVCQGSNAEMLVKSIDNYGPYKVECDHFEACAGPKSRNMTEFGIDMVKVGDDYIFNINYTFLANCHMDEVKITVYTVKDKQKSILLNYKVNDPCNHYAVANMVERYLHATKCLIKKGFYSVTLNISEVTRLFFGTSFFYGKFLMKANILSKQGNICCLLVSNIYTKKV